MNIAISYQFGMFSQYLLVDPRADECPELATPESLQHLPIPGEGIRDVRLVGEESGDVGGRQFVEAPHCQLQHQSQASTTETPKPTISTFEVPAMAMSPRSRSLTNQSPLTLQTEYKFYWA